MAIAAFEGELKEEGRGKKEEGRRKKIRLSALPFSGFSTNSPLPMAWQLPIPDSRIKKHIFRRRASSGKNASNQCNHHSEQRVLAAKFLLGAIA